LADTGGLGVIIGGFIIHLLVINALMLKLTAAIVPNFQVHGFLPALIGALLLSALNLLLSLFGI
jgi:uncharacterized membrane protein YvlD (DUF360 family)